MRLNYDIIKYCFYCVSQQNNTFILLPITSPKAIDVYQNSFINRFISKFATKSLLGMLITIFLFPIPGRNKNLNQVSIMEFQ